MITLSLGAIGVPIVTILFMAAGLGYLIQSRKRKRKEEEVEEGEISPAKGYHRRKSVFSDAYSMIQESIVRPGMDLLEQDMSGMFEPCDGREEEEEEEEQEEGEGVSSVHVLSKDKEEEENEEEEEEKEEDDGGIVRKPTVRFKSQSFEPTTHSDLIMSQSPTRPLSFDAPLSKYKSKTITEEEEEEERERGGGGGGGRERDPLSLSSSTSLNQQQLANNQIFLVLITSCTVLVLIRHSWLLLLAIPLVLGWCIKRLIHLPITAYVYSIVNVYVRRFKEWLYRHQSKLFPQPIPTLYQLCLDIDNLALMLLRSTAGSVVSTLIIIGLLLGSVGLSAFLVFQIQLELSHTVGLATQVLNTSLDDNEWIQRYVGMYMYVTLSFRVFLLSLFYHFLSHLFTL